MDAIPKLLQSHFEDPYHRGSCERATHGSQSHDRSTHHFVSMQLRIDEAGDNASYEANGDCPRLIEEAWFDSQGCVCCEGAASVLVQYSEGKSVAELGNLEESVYLQLTELNRIAEPPSCQMLAWTALKAALNSTEVDDNRPLFGGPSLGEES